MQTSATWNGHLVPCEFGRLPVSFDAAIMTPRWLLTAASFRLSSGEKGQSVTSIPCLENFPLVSCRTLFAVLLGVVVLLRRGSQFLLPPPTPPSQRERSCPIPFALVATRRSTRAQIAATFAGRENEAISSRPAQSMKPQPLARFRSLGNERPALGTPTLTKKRTRRISRPLPRARLLVCIRHRYRFAKWLTIAGACWGCCFS